MAVPPHAYVLLYSIDRKSSFRAVVNALEAIRARQKSVPIILAGNKVDLERRRAVSAHGKPVLMCDSDFHFPSR